MRINYDISSNIKVSQFIRDLSGTIYYWINNLNYVIESNSKYIILSFSELSNL